MGARDLIWHVTDRDLVWAVCLVLRHWPVAVWPTGFEGTIFRWLYACGTKEGGETLKKSWRGMLGGRLSCGWLAGCCLDGCLNDWHVAFLLAVLECASHIIRDHTFCWPSRDSLAGWLATCLTSGLGWQPSSVHHCFGTAAQPASCC